MLIIDSQVHTYEANRPERPWRNHLAGPDHVTGDEMVAALDAVGVDGALLVSPFAMYGYDPSYAVEVHAAHPGRFGLITPVDAGNPAVADIVADWAAREGSVGVRVIMPEVSEDPDDPGVRRVLAAATRHGMPVNFFCWGRLDQMAGIAARNPDASIVIDHLGLTQPLAPPVPAEPFADLPRLLLLSRYPNVSVKISGAATLSHEGFPYRDIWGPIYRIFDAFGIERCLWGTDWTRATSYLTYAQGVEAFHAMDRLTEDERAALMGGTLSRLYRWSPVVPG